VTASSTSQAPPTGYLERLRTPWWWYLGAVAVSLLLGAEFGVAVSGWLAWVPLVVLLPLSLLLVHRLSSGTVAIAGTTLRAGDRSLDLADVEQAIDLNAAELRRLVGRHSDPLAFTFIRSWIGPGVQLVLRPGAQAQAHSEQPAQAQQSELSDQAVPAYPEPYWVVSSRHPDRLVAAVRAAAATAG
jgi:hypothetical protein